MGNALLSIRWVIEIVCPGGVQGTDGRQPQELSSGFLLQYLVLCC